MKFEQLFNWIRFKTSPPSVNNNNMLYVERDSKHRRLMTSLGLTFRNNNWVESTKTNINLKDQKLFKHILIILIVVLITVMLLNYTPLSVVLSQNPLIFYIWSVADNKLIWLSSLFWCFRALLNVAIHYCIAWFMKKIYKINDTNESLWDYTPFTQKTTFKTSINTTNEPLVSKKHILYSWLKNNDTEKSQKFMENLYDATGLVKVTTNHYQLLNTLFNQTGLLALNNYNSLLLKQQLNTLIYKNNFNFYNYTTRYAINDNFCKLLLSYYLTRTLNANRKFNNRYVVSTNSMALHLINTEWLKYPLQTNTRVGLFYVSQLNQSALNNNLSSMKELFALSNSLTEQKNINNWTIWLYKNSSTSRDFLRFTHKITNIKKLVSSGFWDSKSTTGNLWASELDKALTNPKSFYNTMYSTTYANLKNNNNPFLIRSVTNYVNTPSSGFINYSNPSLFWITKRLHTFNNSQEVNVSSTLMIKRKLPFLTNRINNFIKNENFLIQNAGTSTLSMGTECNDTIPKLLLLKTQELSCLEKNKKIDFTKPRIPTSELLEQNCIALNTKQLLESITRSTHTKKPVSTKILMSCYNQKEFSWLPQIQLSQSNDTLNEMPITFANRPFPIIRSRTLTFENKSLNLFKRFSSDTHYGISLEFCNNWSLNYDDLESLTTMTSKRLNTTLQLEYYPLRQPNLKPLGDLTTKNLKPLLIRKLLKSEEQLGGNSKRFIKLTNRSKFKRFYL